jgi:hypothetical protein
MCPLPINDVINFQLAWSAICGERRFVIEDINVTAEDLMG